MPRYDYKCSACGAQYEKREGFDAPAVQACPTCQGEARRVLTPPAIVFKGSGWYVNDSRKGSSGSDGGASTATADSSDTKESTPAKTETSTPAPAAPAATSNSSTSSPSTGSGS